MKLAKLGVIAAIVLGGLVACSMATAQEAGKEAPKKGKGGFSAEQRLERLTTTLSLTDEQKPKVKAVLEDTAKKMQAVAPEERREKGRTIREEETKKLKEILTADQFKKYEEGMARFGKKGSGGEKKAEKKSE
jgi:Spy/CpxP family protein refolding chaperone